MSVDLFALHGDRMKKALQFVFDSQGRALPDPATFECLARVGVGLIDHENEPFNADSFIGMAYVLMNSFDDPKSPHYDDIQQPLKQCVDAIAGMKPGGLTRPKISGLAN